MKKAKIVASLVLAAAMGTTVFAAACGKKEEEEPPVSDVGKEFVISEYAHSLNSTYFEENVKDYSDTEYVKKELGDSLRFNYTNLDYNASSDLVIGTVKTTTVDPDTHAESTEITKTLYNVRERKTLFSGCKDITRFMQNTQRFEYFKLKKETDDGYVYSYVGPDGKYLPIRDFTDDDSGLVSGNSHLMISFIKSYKDKEKNTLAYYSVTYGVPVLDDDGETVVKYERAVKYFCKKLIKDGGFTFFEVKEQDVEVDPESDYPAGTVVGPEKEELADKDIYPASNWKGIEVLVEGEASMTYTFYKNDAVISSVVTYNPKLVGYVGNYMYYYEIETVSFDAKEGYNYEYTYSGTTYKSNYTLYRFDFVKGGEPEEVETDYIVIDTEATLFNTLRDSFDKIAVHVVKKENGVAVDNPESKAYLLVLDDEFKVSVDLSAKSITDTEIIKLMSGRYLVGDKIVNDELETVAKIPNGYNSRVSVWEEKNMLVCKGYRGTMLVDFFGRVKIEPSYGDLTFYGTMGYNSNNHKLYSEYYSSGVELEDLVATGKDESIEFRTEGLIVKSYDYYQEWTVNDQTPSRPARLLSVYSASGSALFDIDDIDTTEPVTYTVVGGAVILKAYVYTEDEGWHSEPVYWLIG